MKLPFRRVPEAASAGAPAQAFVLEMDPGRFRPALSVQTAWNHSRGLIRGVREGGVLIEDHIREEIAPSGELRAAGTRIFGAAAMRREVWTIAEHLEAHHRSRPGRPTAAWVGNGNLLANPHFIGFTEGTLFSLRDEPWQSRTYTCLVVRRTGVSIETLRTADFGEAIECAAFGQQVVAGGVPITRRDLIAKAVAGEFSDLRHLFLFARLNRGDERWIDAGLAAFYDEAGGQNVRAIAAALGGSAVTADVSQFPEDEVRCALHGKGYEEYELSGGVLRFVPREGIYPHNLIGIRGDGLLFSVALQGLSNRVGVTLEGAGEVMAQLGAREALILDNGADVTMGRGGEVVLAGRSRFRSMLLFTGGPDLPRISVFG